MEEQPRFSGKFYRSDAGSWRRGTSSCAPEMKSVNANKFLSVKKLLTFVRSFCGQAT